MLKAMVIIIIGIKIERLILNEQITVKIFLYIT